MIIINTLVSTRNSVFVSITLTFGRHIIQLFSQWKNTLNLSLFVSFYSQSIHTSFGHCRGVILVSKELEFFRLSFRPAIESNG